MSEHTPKDDAQRVDDVDDGHDDGDPPRASGPLTHEEAVGLLDALRDGELSGDEAARVEAHTETCARCQAVESALGGGLRSAVTRGAASESTDLLPGVQRRLRLRSRGRFYASDERKRVPSPWPLVIASLAILVELVVSYVLIGRVGPASPPPRSSGPLSAPTAS